MALRCYSFYEWRYRKASVKESRKNRLTTNGIQWVLGKSIIRSNWWFPATMKTDTDKELLQTKPLFLNTP